ncbi:MAG: toxin-antitoxin system HicB family antitoxin [Thermoleophilia bacterium]|nr:toxin-antitoxin system HicB family antitoxin [Thermoleophilia bacterium]
MSAIQVKNVPDELHERARERARSRGLSLSQYILDLIETDLRLPSVDEWFARANRAEFDIGLPAGRAAEVVREARAENDTKIDQWIEDIRKRRE